MSGELDIANLWRGKYSSILNSVHERTEGMVSEALHCVPRGRNDFTSMEEICLFASELSNDQSPGTNGASNEFYKVSPGFIYTWLSNFNKCAFPHSCLPSSLTDVVVVPILKSSLNDPVDAINFRPIAVASGASKIIEKIILVRLKTFISTR